MHQILEQKRYTCRAIAKDLESYIVKNRLAEGVELFSTEEMADRYGVSPKTIHRSLDILVRRGMVFRVRGNGTFVKNSRSQNQHLHIGLFTFNYATMEIPALDLLAFENSLQNFRHVLEEAGHKVELFFDADPADAVSIRKVALDKFDIIVAKAGYLDNPQTAALLRNLPMPLVLFGDDIYNYGPWHQVFFDYRPGFGAALNFLTERRIKKVFVAGCDYNITWRRRYEAIVEMAQKNGFGVERIHSFQPTNVNLDMPVLIGRECGKHYVKNYQTDTAIISLSDYFTVGILDVLRDYQLEAGRDVTLISYDNLLNQIPSCAGQFRYSAITHPQTTAYNQLLKLVTEVSETKGDYYRSYAIPATEFIRESSI